MIRLSRRNQIQSKNLIQRWLSIILYYTRRFIVTRAIMIYT
nr:MAG TPA: hypothetical protein [Caudoviricetes sp.]